MCDEEGDDSSNDSSGQSDGDESVKKPEPRLGTSRASSRELEIPELMGADLYVFRFSYRAYIVYQVPRFFKGLEF